MKIWLGQGNPGSKYAHHRHNVGFMAIDAIAQAHNFTGWKKKFNSQMSLGEIDGVKTLLLKPETFYNQTGLAGHEALNYYKRAPAELTVFHDEIDLTPGKMRTKIGGGHAGNNGLKSLMAHVHAPFQRVRIGIGHPGDKAMVNPHVLSDFYKAERDWLDRLLDAIALSAPLLAKDKIDSFQSDVMRLAPAPKLD